MSEALIFAQQPVAVRYQTPRGDVREVQLWPLTLGDLQQFRLWQRANTEADEIQTTVEMLRLSANWLQPGISAAEIMALPLELLTGQEQFAETLRVLGIKPVEGGGLGNVPEAAVAAVEPSESSETSPSASSTELDGLSTQ